MILYVPPGDARPAMALDIEGRLLLDARRALLADAPAEDIGLSLMALGTPKTGLPALRALADRGSLVAMAGTALDLLGARTGLQAGVLLDCARAVAVAALTLPAAPTAVPAAPTRFAKPVPPSVVYEPMPDPYEGTRVDGETWPEFARRTNNGRKPGSEAAMERWRQIDQEFAPREG